ncbi:MAG: NAD-binding protein [candidate division NC10 bacterium]|nr:NAD-binding protein [candidate division NC10 bacterium]MDE2320451.1 NAD-binding protein [candidate division NC10 bacterium]
MNIIVVGCGRIGAELAYRLFQKGHQVAIIDQVASALNNLPTDFRGRTVHGEALATDVLRRAGIEQADGLAAVTNSDSLNAVVAHVAQTVYHVAQVVVRNYHPRWRILHEAFGLQVVSSTSWGAARIEELLYPTVARSVFSAGNGEVEIYELVVPKAWHDRSLHDLLPAGECLAVALTRAGKAMLPSSEERLEVGDILHLSTNLAGIETLRRRLKAA